MIGQTVSHYRILEKIGEGGMGVVYMAEDTHLGRHVAIKFLSAAHDHSYRARFLREARAVSTLSHPHIAIIHDYGESPSGQPFIVMEYIKGETLSELLNRSALTLSRALEIIEAVAEALGAAHARGIVHRDIKPSNVLVNREGDVKVVDFGLVKQLQDDEIPESNPDANTLLGRTSSNVIVGTPLYLSPEQAMGADVDARSDLFAIGALLYECLAGKPAFSGGSLIEIGAQIIHFNPLPPSSINNRVPPELDRITLKALAKKRESRYQSAADFVADLKAARLALNGNEDSHRTQRLVPGRSSHSSALKSISETLRRPRVSIAFFLLALVIVGLSIWAIITLRPHKPSQAFDKIRMTKITNSGKTLNASISPDGTYVAEIIDDGGKQSLWLRQIDVPAASKQIVPQTEGQYEGLTFSRDGKYVYYVIWENNARDVLYRVAVLGDSPRKLSTEVNSPVGFSPDGRNLAFIRTYNQGESAVIVANSDGTDERLLAKRKVPNFFNEVAPAWSPDGTSIACAVRSSSGGFRGSVVKLRLSDGTESPLTSEVWALVEKVVWLKDNRGLIITARDQSSSPFQIWHISYPEGGARRITSDLDSYVDLSVSDDSSKLLTVQSTRLSSISVAKGRDASQFAQITAGVSEFYGLAWTPDGRIVFGSVKNGNPDIWIMDGNGGGEKQLTFNSSIERDPAVSPDGRYIVYTSNQNGRFNVWRMDIDGGNLKPITSGDDEEYPQVSPDSAWVVYQGFVNGIPTLWRASIDGGTPIQLTDKYSNWPAISPDGKLIACSYRGETGQWRLTIIPFEGGAPEHSFDMPIPVINRFVWQRIRWTVDGKGIAYIDKRGGVSNIWSQPLTGGPPQKLTDFKADQIFNFAWSSDGQALAYLRGNITSDVVLVSEAK